MTGGYVVTILSNMAIDTLWVVHYSDRNTYYRNVKRIVDKQFTCRCVNTYEPIEKRIYNITRIK